MQVTTHARVQVPTLLLSPASQLLCTLTSSRQQTSNRGPFPSHGRPQELVPGFQLWPDQAAATAYTWEVEQQEAFCLPCKLKVWNANFVSVKHIHNTIHYDVVIFRVFFFFQEFICYGFFLWLLGCVLDYVRKKKGKTMSQIECFLNSTLGYLFQFQKRTWGFSLHIVKFLQRKCREHSQA